MNIKNLMVIVIAICLGISFNVFAKKNDESNERYNDYYSDDYKQRYDDDDDSYYEDSYSYSSDNYYNYEYSDDEDSYNHDDYYGHEYYGHEYDDSGKDKKDKKTDRHLVYNLIAQVTCSLEMSQILMVTVIKMRHFVLKLSWLT